MNSLTLRISGGGNKKTKNTFSFATVTIPETNRVVFDINNKDVQQFVEAPSVDQQLTNLKNILDCINTSLDKNLIKFLVIVFLQAEVKHPLKCFLTRSITRSGNLQQPFTEVLSEEIDSLVSGSQTSYRCYVDVVAKVATCVENFPAGAAAVKAVDMRLAEYLKNGLNCTVQTLSDTNCLSPTEKNEVFNLAHSILRLILYIAQKVSPEHVHTLNSMEIEIRSCLKYLLFDEDVPMDTKSVCGIVFVTLYMLQNTPDSWVDILVGGNKDETIQSFLKSEAARLCLYSAIATAVPADRLHAQTVEDMPAVILLTTNVIAVGERMSTETTFNLAVARTLLQISKGLDKGGQLDPRLVDVLLGFVWGHLDHHMDSVRHLSAQALGNVVKYCARLDGEGDGSALDELFVSQRALDRRRKSYYVSVAALAGALPPALLARRQPRLVHHVLDHLHVQAVQASATTALETLLHKQSNVPPEVMYERWIVPIVEHAARPLDCTELAILEGLLTKVVKQDERVMDYILPHIQQERDEGQLELKCVLMLLNVARRAGFVGRWADLVPPARLQHAAVSACEQTRVLLLSLVAESPRTTEVLAPDELDLALHFLKYNGNARSPNFRQLVLSLVKKLLKRLEDSYKVMQRETDPCDAEPDYYVRFLEGLRAQCFASLLPGASYGRRCLALQTLACCERINLHHDRHWEEEYVEKLLLHLEDSYESNKGLALEILQYCPLHLLQDKKYSISLDLGDIMRQASSVKPTDCVSAAYKLSVLIDRLPHTIMDGRDWSSCEMSEPVRYTLTCRLLAALEGELAVCRSSVLCAARSAPMYGLLHCIRRIVDTLPPRATLEEESWASLVARLVGTCVAVNDSVASVVNNSSPEGHLPMDMGGVVVTDHGNTGDVRLADGRPVTAQMVLLCAWRSVKEVSLVLGGLCSRLELGGRALPVQQVLVVGQHFTQLLAETKHRGAFEQAYVGFTSLLARLWRCRNPELHELPRRWLDELMAAIQSPSGHEKLCATRRSAGLPFMIQVLRDQALVTTELQVRENPTCFHACMSSLLALAGPPGPAGRGGAAAGDTRTHCTNVLRALVRHAALRDAVAPHVGAAIRVALEGFDGTTWEERNSSTLLFSALVVRVFGVRRSRTAELCARNRMTGRVFFLRYPALYDYLLGKLEEVSGGGAGEEGEGAVLRPALYPVLLLLARLYPSALEGTVSNLKVVSFVPHVMWCARCADLRARRLAAAALPPLVSPQLYMSHLDTLFQQLEDENIKRNHCHGLLLQISSLLARRPDELTLGGQGGDGGLSGLRARLARSLWALRQPCYVIIDEYLRMMNLILWKFESLLDRDMIDQIVEILHNLLFKRTQSPIVAGKAVCLANGAYLLFIILNIQNSSDLCRSVHDCLAHESYDVVLSALNYILIMHGDIEIEDKFQEHLSSVSKDVREEINTPTFLELLCDVMKTNKYLECSQKALRVLTLSGDTQPYVIRAKEGNIEITDDIVFEKLFYYIENEHENLTHIYLHSLTNFLTKMLRSANVASVKVLEAIRVIFACSSSDNSDATRRVVVDFLEENIEILMSLVLEDLHDGEQFEYKATLYCTLVCMLEDDDVSVSERAADVTRQAAGGPGHVTVTRAADGLRARAAREGVQGEAVALLATLALLDFRCQVVATDEGSEECRVFDQNERYNVSLEETVWSAACAHHIKTICGTTSVVDEVRAITSQDRYRPTLERLCGDNFTIFSDVTSVTSDLVGINPKVQLFISELSSSNKILLV